MVPEETHNTNNFVITNLRLVLQRLCILQPLSRKEGCRWEVKSGEELRNFSGQIWSFTMPLNCQVYWEVSSSDWPRWLFKLMHDSRNLTIGFKTNSLFKTILDWKLIWFWFLHISNRTFLLWGHLSIGVVLAASRLSYNQGNPRLHHQLNGAMQTNLCTRRVNVIINQFCELIFIENEVKIPIPESILSCHTPSCPRCQWIWVGWHLDFISETER